MDAPSLRILPAEAAPGEKVLLLGDPRLRVLCDPIEDFQSREFRQAGARLVRALEQFRAEHGFGRAVAAPQIGIAKRLVAMNLGWGPFLLANPEISTASAQRFTLWDDCMSFPWLLVRLERHVSLSLSYEDENGVPQRWCDVEQSVSELLQHELDHLDGILAIDHALDRDSIIARTVYLERKADFDRQVDYVIRSTIAASPSG